jgi:hypothetical protein
MIGNDQPQMIGTEDRHWKLQELCNRQHQIKELLLGLSVSNFSHRQFQVSSFNLSSISLNSISAHKSSQSG